MKNLNIDYIKQQAEKLKEIDTKYNSPKLFFPLEWLLMCGWDKISYDEYLSKYCAGTLNEQENTAFTILYTNMLQIISRIEVFAATKKLDYYYYKTALEQFAGSGLVSSKQQQKLQDRINKFKKQQEMLNNSGLEIK